MRLDLLGHRRPAALRYAVIPLVFALIGAAMLPPDRAASLQAGDCVLASYRERVDATLASMVVEREERSATTDFRGRPFDWVDVYFSGTLDGCVTKGGPLQSMTREPYSWLYDAPDVALPQEHLLIVDRTQPYPLPLRPGDGNTSPRYYARGTFEAAHGAGMVLLLPAPGTPWNGKLYLTQHGSGSYRPLEPLVERTPDDYPMAGIGHSLFVPAFVDQG